MGWFHPRREGGTFAGLHTVNWVQQRERTWVAQWKTEHKGGHVQYTEFRAHDDMRHSEYCEPVEIPRKSVETCRERRKWARASDFGRERVENGRGRLISADAFPTGGIPVTVQSRHRAASDRQLPSATSDASQSHKNVSENLAPLSFCWWWLSAQLSVIQLLSQVLAPLQFQGDHTPDKRPMTSVVDLSYLSVVCHKSTRKRPHMFSAYIW